MLYLLLAVFSSSLVALALKFSAKKTNGTYGVYVFNYVTCFVTGFLFLEDKNLFHTPLPVVGFGAFSGFLFLASLALYQYNIQRNGTVLSAVFAKLGIILPTVLSFTVFGETPKALQILGILLAVAAILVINLQKADPHALPAEQKHNRKAALDLIILLLVGGACDSMTKVFEFVGDRSDDDRFMFFNFFFCLHLLCIHACKREKDPQPLRYPFRCTAGCSKLLLYTLFVKSPYGTALFCGIPLLQRRHRSGHQYFGPHLLQRKTEPQTTDRRWDHPRRPYPFEYLIFKDLPFGGSFCTPASTCKLLKVKL